MKSPERRQPLHSPRRADAKRNRERLLSAADAVFLEQGAGAALEEVARRASVGIGTLYRHFPSREALLAEACDARLLSLAEESRTARPQTARGQALCAFLEDLVQHASVYRGLAASLGVVLKSHSAGCHAATEEGRRLLREAQRAGDVRRDVSFDDVVSVAIAISLAIVESKSRDPSGIRRLVSLFMDGLATRPR